MFNGKDSNGNIRPVKISNSGIFPSKLANQRYNGNSYSAVANQYITASSVGIMSIYNTSGNNKKVYIYNIDVQISADLATGGDSYLSIWTLNANPTSGTTVTANKLQIINGDSSTHSCSIKHNVPNGTFTTVNKLFVNYLAFSSSSTDIDENYVLNLYDEMIELPAGKGIVLKLTNSSGSGLNYFVTVKFLEVDDTVEM